MKEEEEIRSMCEKYGYGQVMSVASVLWKEYMESNNMPTSGVFVPTLASDIRKDKKKHYMKMIIIPILLCITLLSSCKTHNTSTNIIDIQACKCKYNNNRFSDDFRKADSLFNIEMQKNGKYKQYFERIYRVSKK